MSTLIIALILSASPGEAADSQTQPANNAEEPRAYHEIDNDIRDAMKREALAKSMSQRGEAVRDLAALFVELKHDPRLELSPTLTQYKTRLWSRLTSVKKKLEQQIAREKRLADRDRSPDDIAAEQAAIEQADQAAESLAEQLTLISYSMGGPGQLFADSSGAFGGGGASDNGQALVELIQRTIAPDFWDVNGGPGSIVYYAPLKVLVVRATGEVHRKIGGAAEALRAAGR